MNSEPEDLIQLADNSYSNKNKDESVPLRTLARHISLYDREREKHKMSNFYTMTMMLKTSMGIMFLSMPYFFGQIGFILGSVILLISLYSVWYTLSICSNLSYQIEENSQHTITIGKYNQLIDIILKDKPWGKIVSLWNLIGISGICICIVMADIIESGQFFENMFGYDRFIGKTICVVIVGIVLSWAVVPEKLKFVGMLSGILGVLIWAFIFGERTYFQLNAEHKKSKKEYIMADFEKCGAFITNNLACMAIFASIFTIRDLSKTKKKFTSLLPGPLIFTGVVFYSQNFSVVLAAGVNGLKEVAIEYYPKESWFMHVLFGAYLFSLVIFAPVWLLTTSFVLEDSFAMKCCIKEANGEINQCRLASFRIGIQLVLWGILFFPINQPQLSMVCGAQFTFPIIYFVPIILKYSYSSEWSICHKIHDFLLIAYAIVFNAWGIFNMVQYLSTHGTQKLINIKFLF